jgi:trehalose 6-phosphate phosphatase
MTAALSDALAPLRAEPTRSAVLLDVDGTLAPIVRNAADAHVPETTRTPLIEVARRYALVACVSGRRAADARRIVSLGSMAYLGSHGTEFLPPGGTEAVLDSEVAAWTRRIQDFAARNLGPDLPRLRIRPEDKRAIFALHWRGAPDEPAAREAVERIAARAEESGLRTHWGRKVLEIRPPVRIDKGAGIVSLFQERPEIVHALYVGDDATDLDAFRGLDELIEEGRLTTAVRVGVASPEGPSEIAESADLMVDGTRGVRAVLEALLATE